MSNLTSDAWNRLSDHLDLPTRSASGPVLVTATKIKEVTGREPRLMTKFDTRESRPSALANHTILPLNNGTYAILPGDGYGDIGAATAVKHWPVPRKARKLASLPWGAGPTSESQMLDMAAATGILHDFLRDPDACLTIRGRLRSPRFEFTFASRVGDISLSADGVQIEVDSGLEGTGIHLVEGKLGTRTNFHVRQLYYPMRMWDSLVSDKPVSAMFLSWSNAVFSMREFKFDPLDRYHGIVPGAAVDYYLDEPSPIPTLDELLDETAEESAPSGVPFPQADDFRRVIDVVDAVASAIVAQDDMAARYGFDKRQADYYANAALYLGLLEKGSDGFGLSAIGRRFVGSQFSERQVILLTQLASRPVFRDAIAKTSADGTVPSKAFIVDLITRRTTLTGETPRRRAGTVAAWTRWAQKAAAIKSAT